jgi:uncharacterized membrane protein
MRAAALVPVLLLGVGLLLVADAVLRGAASLALVVIFPVVYGSDAEFLLGVVLLLVGFVSLPLAWAPATERSPVGPHAGGPRDAPSTETMGLVLIGPVPIFFGGWKDVSCRTKATVAAMGALLLLATILFVVLR